MIRITRSLHSGFVSSCLFFLLGIAAIGQASTYETISVIDGGSVKGKVQFIGSPPDPSVFRLNRYPDQMYCGALSDGSGYRVLREVLMDSTGGLKDVIVTIEGVTRGKPFLLQETTLEANICQFVPYVSVMRNDHPLIVKNIDSVSHDLQVYERDREHVLIMFHRPALTKGGTQGRIHFTGDRRGVIMQCGMHPYMQGHGLAVDNPYYAITESDGSFAIRDLPAGTYRMRAWHPRLGEQEQEITVEGRQDISIDFIFRAK